MTPEGVFLEFLDRHCAAARSDPYSRLHALREAAPAVFTEAVPGWVLTRYEDCVAVLRSPGWSSDIRRSPGFQRTTQEFAGIGEVLSNVLLFMDPPDHTRLRSLVSKAFTPRAVERLRPVVEPIVGRLLEGLAEKGDVEFLADFAFPLPVEVICTMLGVPAADQGFFREQIPKLTPLLEFSESTEDLLGAGEATFALGAYFGPLFDERRRSPKDDLISALVQAEEDGDRLRPEELLTTTILLLGAGHETTMNLLGNGLLALLRHPDQLKHLREDPGCARAAVEELLRYDSPVQLTARVAAEPKRVAGVDVEEGQEVVVLIAAANRDPARFAAPDELDVRRANNAHLSFGGGAHFCLGAALARLEAEVALPALARRFGNIELADEPRWRPSTTLRGLQALPLRVAR